MPTLFVHTLEGHVYTTTIASFEKTTVGKLKILLEVQHGIPVARQRLIYCGVVLPCDKPLSDFGIDGVTVMYLVTSAPEPVQEKEEEEEEEVLAEAARPAETRTEPEALGEPQGVLSGPHRDDGAVVAHSESAARVVAWLTRAMQWMFTACRQSPRACAACGHWRTATRQLPPPPLLRVNPQLGGMRARGAEELSPVLERAVGLTSHLAATLAADRTLRRSSAKASRRL